MMIKVVEQNVALSLFYFITDWDILYLSQLIYSIKVILLLRQLVDSTSGNRLYVSVS